MRNRLQQELGDLRAKQRRVVTEVEVSADEAKNIVIKGQPIQFVSNYKPITDQVRIVLSLFDPEE